MKKLILTTALTLCATNVGAAEIGVLFGGGVKHFSSKFAPSNGYNENTKTIGIEVLQDKEGVVFGGSVAKFKDSFNKSSYWLLGIAEYKHTFKYVSASGGVGIGKLKTSYYNGVFATPYIKLRDNYTGLYVKVMVQPISNNRVDSFIATNVGISRRF